MKRSLPNILTLSRGALTFLILLLFFFASFSEKYPSSSSSFLANITDFSMDIWRENGMLFFRFWHGVRFPYRQSTRSFGIRVAGTAQYSSSG